MFQQLLSLDDLGNNCFCSISHQKNFRNSLFGGQVVAQALMAAGRTARNLPPHSLHAYFLRPGKTDSQIQYQVEVLRDGRSVSTRAVKAYQDDTLIFTMQASFHQAEKGFEHSTPPPKDRLEPKILSQHLNFELSNHLKSNAEQLGLSPLEFVPFNEDLFSETASDQKQLQFWIKGAQEISQEPLFQYCALAFSSDIGLLGTALLNHPCSLFHGKVIPASMDHSLWFHKQPNLNEWNRYVTESPWAGGARALCSGKIYDFNDNLIASVAQEGLIRPIS